jgi:hypothetical protein
MGSASDPLARALLRDPEIGDTTVADRLALDTWEDAATSFARSIFGAEAGGFSTYPSCFFFNFAIFSAKVLELYSQFFGLSHPTSALSAADNLERLRTLGSIGDWDFGGESSSRMMVMEMASGCRMGSLENRPSPSRLEPYWLNGIGWTWVFAGAEAGLDADSSLAEGRGTLLLPTDDLVPGFFMIFFW